MLKCGVIGKPINHSLSPTIHQLFAKQAGILLAYEKIEGDETNFENQVEQFFKEEGLGLNITLPFKQRAFNLCQLRSPRCEQAKAANTITRSHTTLSLDNTDGAGLLKDLSQRVNLTHKKVLILGAGGAARGIINPLLMAGVAELWLTNRTFAKAELIKSDFPTLHVQPIDQIEQSFDLIINATSASLFEGDFSFVAHLLNAKPFCYDLAYSLTKPTSFVTYALERHCDAQDGLGMLIEQAALSFFIWHGFMPDTSKISLSIKKC